MVRFIPFNQDNPEENNDNADIIQRTQMMLAIRNMLIAYGVNYLPPENIDLDDDDKIDQDNFQAHTLGVSKAISDHVDDAEDPVHSFKCILGHFFINQGYFNDDFGDKLEQAVSLLSEFIVDIDDVEEELEDED